MKVTYTTPNARIVIECEIAKGKDAFEFIGKVQELFEEEECGCCHSKKIRCEVREKDSFKFYQWTCCNPECGARLELGQHKEGGGLFVKRWDKDAGRPLPDNGWFIWKPSDDNGHDPAYTGKAVNGKRPVESPSGVPF